ncbi:MAG: heparinase II/III family protein [Thermoguttaceae bacterium]|nr:heparinase II/III family protein [Thermoguttaceae bacterium]
MIRAETIASLLCVLLCSAAAAFGLEIPAKDVEAVAARATELAAVIPAEPVPLIPSITDREKWEAFASLTGTSNVVKRAEKYLAEPIPELPEDLYKEFFVNGNRSNFQDQRGVWSNRFTFLAMAELVENKGRFLPALEEMIRMWCGYPSWTLPAHDHLATIYDGKDEGPDLVATAFGGSLGIVVQAMEPVLSPEVTQLARENIRRRVLAPVRNKIEKGACVMMDWVVGTSNWNPVCYCGTTAAALSVCSSAEERAWFLAAAEHFVSSRFFLGITDDGYCSEGIGYWGYGFGHFAMLAELAWRGSGAVNLYACPKVRPLTEFALKMEVAPGCYAAFADCSLTARPDKTLLALLSRRLGLGLSEIERKYGYPKCRPGSPISAAVYFFPAFEAGGELPALAPSPDGKPADFLAEPVSRFPDAGVVICRPPKGDDSQFAAVFKGGNNGEMHNHNDIGTFCVLRGGVWLVIDPGSEPYTKRTFSEHRYEGELLNSFGHPVPRINGTLQIAGRKAQAEVLEFEPAGDSASYTLDLTSAYPDSGAERVIRRYEYTRAGGETPNRLTVTDALTFAPDAPRAADFPLITFENWTPIDERTIEITPRPAKDGSAGPGIRVTVSACDENGNPVPGRFAEEIVGRDDPLTPKKPKRIAWETELAEGRTLTVTTTIE